MANVTAREFAAGGTRAGFFDRSFVQRELCILQIQRACGCERRAISGESRWQHAIEHVHSPRDHFHHLRRRAESHRITWFVRRQKRFGRFNRTHHLLFWFTYAHPADRVSVEIELHYGLRRCAPQIFERSALHNTEEKLTRTAVIPSGAKRNRGIPQRKRCARSAGRSEERRVGKEWECR